MPFAKGLIGAVVGAAIAGLCLGVEAGPRLSFSQAAADSSVGSCFSYWKDSTYGVITFTNTCEYDVRFAVCVNYTDTGLTEQYNNRVVQAYNGEDRFAPGTTANVPYRYVVVSSRTGWPRAPERC